MAEQSKKISFGFAKSIKKPILDKPKLYQEKKVDYIECIDEKTIKVIGKEEKKEEPLIIPLLESNIWHNRIINKIDASKLKTSDDKIQNVTVRKESKKVSNGVLTSIDMAVSPDVQIKTVAENKTLTLDEQAAKEIIEDLNAVEKNGDESCDITLSLVKGQDLEGAEESTLEDYEKVPLDIFGSAMLRGMGWKPGEGIGKNPKLVTPIIPELRPIGMGLGADKITLQKQGRKTEKEVELKIQKGSFIKIIAGKQSNAYGQIEGFDDAGRLIVKMALNGNTISVNECIVQVVTKAEYSKNSKVLNAAKYEEHKKKEGTSKRRSASSENCSSNDNSDTDIPDRKRNRKENDREHKSKKSRKKSKTQRDLSDNDSDNKKRNKSRRRSSSSDRIKKAKKSKKYKGRDKERQKDKTSGSFESIDRRKSKKHRRSRSSSRR